MREIGKLIIKYRKYDSLMDPWMSGTAAMSVI